MFGWLAAVPGSSWDCLLTNGINKQFLLHWIEPKMVRLK